MFHKSIKHLLTVYFGIIGLAQAQVIPATTQDSIQTTIDIAPENIITQGPDGSTKYVLGDITVGGSFHYNEMSIITFSGLTKGQEIHIPGEELSNAIRKLWKIGTFTDINIYQTSLQGNVMNIEIFLNELPRINTVTLTGLSKTKREEILKDLKFREKDPKKVITENLLTNTKNYISNKYKKDGYFNSKTEIRVKETGDPKTRDLLIDFNRGKKVRVSSINFEGNKQFSDGKLRKAMKNTKKKSPLNPMRIFKPSKFIEDKYEEDLKSITDAYKSKGYRDARILQDTAVYNPKKNTVDISMKIEEGRKYYIGDIRFIGNTVFNDQQLRTVLGMKKGQVYDGVELQKRTQDHTNPDAFDLTNTLQNDGYLWSRVNMVERVENDTIHLDFRIFEGPQARYNYITVSGNDKTQDYVVLRQIVTRPGQLWRKTELVESHRRLGAMGIFDAQSINPDIKNPDPSTGTVDIDWQVVESGQSQVEVQGGYGGATFIGTLALSFNNFSARNLFNMDEYRPFPMGDAQKMSLRLQASTFFQTYSINFQEPWFLGKRPTQLFGTVSYSRQNMYDFNSRRVDRSQGLGIFTATLGVAKQLTVPDDKFVLSQSITYQQYDLNNYGTSSMRLSFNNGTARNLNYTIDLTRDNVGGIDPFIYPSSGSRISLTGKFSPPYSLFNNVNYADLENQAEYKKRTTAITTNPDTGADVPIGSYVDERGVPVSDYRDAAPDQEKIDQKRFNWLEYYKVNFKADWYTELAPKLVLRTNGQFGFLGAYNQDRGAIPFERYFLGGSGMMNWSMDGREVISLRGYEELSLTPGYSASGNTAIGGTVYNKFSMELRYPISLQAQMKAFVLAFADAGATYTDFKDYNPFRLQRSAGMGVRVSMPMFGMLGIDFGYGFDKVPGTPNRGGWQTHFILGQQF